MSSTSTTAFSKHINSSSPHSPVIHMDKHAQFYAHDIVILMEIKRVRRTYMAYTALNRNRKTNI